MVNVIADDHAGAAGHRGGIGDFDGVGSEDPPRRFGWIDGGAEPARFLHIGCQHDRDRTCWDPLTQPFDCYTVATVRLLLVWRL